MVNYINQLIQHIPLRKGSFNFNGNNIANEFSFLEQNIDNDIEHFYCLNKGDSEKDRYSDIKSYSHNIITINQGKNYINASPINIISNKYFISTQGPKKETIEDFWTMVWEHKCNVIVMLCCEKEGGREKCAIYWDENKVKKFNKIQIEKEEIKKYYIIRKIKIFNKGEQKEKIVHQIHFNGWPDHGVPNTQDGTIFDTFSEIIELVDKIRGDDPIVVHGSAGAGRTGTFISMYYLEKEIKRQIKAKCEIILFNIFNLVRKLKEMRLYLVQTESQYRFIYEFVRYLLRKFNV